MFRCRLSRSGRHAAGTLAPGLTDEIYAEPLFENDTFPLKTLIALYPSAVLYTYRGRCETLVIFGQDQKPRCETRTALSFTGHNSTIHWFTMGSEAIGLESVPPLDPPKDGVLVHMIAKVHRLVGDKMTSEFAMGTCRTDAYSVRCHTIGRSGRVDVDYSESGGSGTQQFPIDDRIFTIPKVEVFMARGQCISLLLDEDATPYCASFAGQAVVDGSDLMIFFTADNHYVIGFTGSIADVAADGNNGLTLPITGLLRLTHDKAGTTPVKGQCHETVDASGHTSIDCKIVTKREGITFKVAFETAEPWQKAFRP